MTKIAFVDCETTGLDPERHWLWDLAIIVADHNEDGVVGVNEHEFHIDAPLGEADPNALRLTRFYERTAKDWDYDEPRVAAEQIAHLLSGRHIVGAVPSFDAAFISRFLRIYEQASAWHYHLIDVECLVAGKLGITPPWDSEELSAAIGVQPTHRHEALADARWAKALYEAVLA